MSFVACFCMKDSKEVRERGKQFVEQIEQLPLSSSEEVSTALAELVKTYGDHLHSFSSGYFSNGRVLLWVAGNGAVVLKRGEKSGKVVQSEKLRIVEGSMHPDDAFIFATEGFLTICSQPFDNECTTDEELAAFCIPIVHADEKAGLAAAYIVQVHEGEKVLQSGGSVVSTAEKSEGERMSRYPWPKLLGAARAGISKLISRSTIIAQQSKRTKIIIALLFFVALLAISLLIGWSKRQASLREQKVQAMVGPFEQQLNEAKAKQAIDLVAARQLAGSSLQGAKDKLPQLSPKSYEYTRLNAFIASTQSYYDSISGEKSLDKLSVYYDLQLVRSDFLAKTMTIGPNTLAFLDTEKNSAIQLSLDKKQPSVPDMTGVVNPKDAAVNEKILYVLGEGVFAGGKTVIPKSDSWVDPQFLRAFGSNLYVLDKGARSLMKYSGSDVTFTGGTNWLLSTPGLDFSLITSVAIDGKVWITTSKGEIFSYAQGTKSAFQVKGLSTPFSSTLKIYTDTNLENLYVLEAQANRVVVLSKEGEYKTSYISKDLSATTSIVVEPTGKTAYLSAGSVVYSLDLQ